MTAEIVAYHIGLSRDGSMNEIVNYGLAFMASILLLLASVENRSRMPFVFSLLMALVWLGSGPIKGIHKAVLV